MTSALTLAELTARTGLDVLDHLEREMTIPVIAGIQAQGDLLVIPHHLITNAVELFGTNWLPVSTTGRELLRSAAGGNPHTLVADPDTCWWTGQIRDNTGLGLGMVKATGIAYLIHPEHGASALAPGQYVIRRQRERGRFQATHLIAD